MTAVTSGAGWEREEPHENRNQMLHVRSKLSKNLMADKLSADRVNRYENNSSGCVWQSPLHGAGDLGATPGNLSDFAGKYSLKGSTVVNASGTTYSGPASLKFNVKKNGKSAVLSSTGSVNVPPAIDVSNVFRFSGKKLEIDRLAPAISTLPVSGSFRIKTNRITGKATYPPVPDLLVTVDVSVKKKGRKATLTVEQVAFSGGIEAYRYTYKATRRLKKSEL